MRGAAAASHSGQGARNSTLRGEHAPLPAAPAEVDAVLREGCDDGPEVCISVKRD
jgi:hypothetical protein